MDNFPPIKSQHISISLLVLALLIAPLNIGKISFAKEDPLNLDQTPQPKPIENKISSETQSNFTKQVEKQIKKVSYQTKIIKDPNLEWGQEVIIQAGQNGQEEIFEETLFWKDKFFQKNTKVEVLKEAQDEVIAKGTKIVIKEGETPHGKIRYRAKLEVFATSYDKNCPGCNETTATGLKAGRGVIAVDPSVIPLGLRVYVSDYGFAVAGDTGGAIKGNRIDVGFDDVREGGWKAHFVDVFVLE